MLLKTKSEYTVDTKNKTNKQKNIHHKDAAIVEFFCHKWVTQKSELLPNSEEFFFLALTFSVSSFFVHVVFLPIKIRKTFKRERL